MPTLAEPFTRYLHLLGVRGHPSGLEGLRTLARQHLFRAPFENLSKLLLFGHEGAGRFVSLAEFLDRIERQDLGGTCHSCNPYLGELLRALGYDVDLLGADMPPRQNCHTCLRVRLDGVAYHVDVGYGGPFREPIRMDRLPHEIPEGSRRYVFGRSATGRGHEMSVFAGAERVHGYILHDTPRALEFFTPALRDSFQPTAPFLNCIRICRFFEDYSLELLDRKLTIHRGAETTQRELATWAEWKAAIDHDFQMPRSPAADAVRVLERVAGKPLFEETAAVCNKL